MCISCDSFGKIFAILHTSNRAWGFDLLFEKNFICFDCSIGAYDRDFVQFGLVKRAYQSAG